MTVYLIHLEAGLSEGPDPRTGKERLARHYIGYTRSLSDRVEHHRNGTGARFLAVANERGIAWDVVRVRKGGSRELEKQLKNRKNSARLCPVFRRAKKNKTP